jgi:hypothetical protein
MMVFSIVDGITPALSKKILGNDKQNLLVLA